MAVTPDEIYTRIKSALDAAGPGTAKEKELYLSGPAVASFNRLLRLSKQAMPSVTGDEWPAELKEPRDTGDARSDSTFAEIRMYYGELLGILAFGMETPAF